MWNPWEAWLGQRKLSLLVTLVRSLKASCVLRSLSSRTLQGLHLGALDATPVSDFDGKFEAAQSQSRQLPVPPESQFYFFCAKLSSS